MRVSISYSQGCVTLAVPKQNPDDWYSERGSIAARKETIARAVAKKYGLFLCEPIDGPSNFYAQFGSGAVHHHLAFTDKRQTVIVVHPLFLKICLLGRSVEHIYGKEPQLPLPLGPDLLQDLAPLYDGKPASHPDSAGNGPGSFQRP